MRGMMRGMPPMRGGPMMMRGGPGGPPLPSRSGPMGPNHRDGGRMMNKGNLNKGKRICYFDKKRKNLIGPVLT